MWIALARSYCSFTLKTKALSEAYSDAQMFTLLPGAVTIVGGPLLPSTVYR